MKETLLKKDRPGGETGKKEERKQRKKKKYSWLDAPVTLGADNSGSSRPSGQGDCESAEKKKKTRKTEKKKAGHKYAGLLGLPGGPVFFGSKEL